MRMLLLLFMLAAATAGATTVPEYEELKAARPDGRSVRVDGLTLTRDAVRIDLRTGVVHFVAPVQGRTVAAIFLGQGTWELTPASAAERRHLRLVANDANLETLSDRFEQLVLLFTDATADEILAHAPLVTGTPDSQATRAYEDYLQRQQRRVGINLHLRVLGDLLNRPDRRDGVFLAPVQGRAHGQVLLAVDPLGLSNLTARFGALGGEEVALISTDDRNGGFWYLSAPEGAAVDGRGRATRPLARADHYAIDTDIDRREMRGSTTITFRPTIDRLRVLPLHISDTLSIESAVLETGAGDRPVGVVRDELQQGWFERAYSDGVADADVALVFPEPLPAGEAARVRITYSGRQVLQGGNGYYSVRARQSWYPNVGTFSDLAHYEMTFRFPRRNELVAVGRQVSEVVEGNQKVAVWHSDVPIRVAGFNYGEFEKLSATDPETGLIIGVYTNREWTPQAKSALADAMNASRLANRYFGPPPFAHLSMTQQVEWTFGQSWPTLVFLPTLALTSSTQRALGLNIDPRAMPSLQEFVNTVAWHEVAHQWWGHQVGWESYRDQWLSEGFAEFTAALMLEFAESRRSYDRYWELRRGELLERRSGLAAVDAGAITQGFRLATQRSPAAASLLLYAKGGYVVHMLRMMMRDESHAADPDRAFRAMMQDFVRSHAGGNPSTDDFRTVAERHMLPVMDLAGTRRLDWFFDQWVHGTDIPRFTSTLQVTDLGNDHYRISGTVGQADVSDTFRSLVPVYLDFGNDRVERLGVVPLEGAASQEVTVEIALPQRPRRVLINARNDVLSR